jgi:dTDP-4-dehydrorhamnose reductase
MAKWNALGTDVIDLWSAWRTWSNFVETMLRLGWERDSVRVVSDIRMAPTYSWDLAESLLRLLAGYPPPEIYHLTNSGEATWHEFAEAVMNEAGLGPRVAAIPSADYPTAARRPSQSVLDTRAAVDRLGKLPPWRDALRRYLDEPKKP